MNKRRVQNILKRQKCKNIIFKYNNIYFDEYIFDSSLQMKRKEFTYKNLKLKLKKYYQECMKLFKPEIMTSEKHIEQFNKIKEIINAK
jgi:hypothetical protein